MTFITQLLKIAGLLFILSLERVIGLPFVFVLLGLIWVDHAGDRAYGQVAVLLIVSYLLAVVYHVSWTVSFLVWLVSSWGMRFGSKPVQQKKRRFLIMVIIQSIFWLWWARLNADYLLLVQFVVSYFLVIIWMKVLRLDQLVSKSQQKMRIS